MFFLKKDKKSKAKDKAKSDYEKCSTLDESHVNNVFRTRIALRVRANLDKTFIQGAKLELKHQADIIAAVKAGKEIPEKPKPDGYQTIKSTNGLILSYAPEEYAIAISDLGGKYQNTELNIAQVFQEADNISKKIIADLKLTSPLQLLDFLREDNSKSIDAPESI